MNACVRSEQVGEVDVGELLAYVEDEEVGGRLLCMAIAPEAGEKLRGNVNGASGRYLYLGTSGGSLVVSDFRR